MTDISPIISKVKKLLELSKSSNVHESAVAAGIANKLIDQYRLSSIDLETSEDIGEPIEEDPEYLYETGKVTPWKMAMVGMLVRHYGCSHWLDNTYATGRKVTRIKVVGRKSDISIVKYMNSWLTLECQRLADKEVKGCGRIVIGSYCSGFVAGVSAQLKASRAEAATTCSSSALVKIDARAEEAREALYKMHTDLRTIKSRSYAHTDYNAFAAGKSKGQSIHLGSSLGASTAKALGR